jgi:exopolysaccharide biosynthesis predicted pyruvyltransferase EpsI
MALSEPTTIEQLRAELDSALAGHVVPDAPCALLDRPNHPNVGDSAIWIGARTLLARHGARLAYASDSGGFDAAELRQSIGDGTVFLTGGGNLGDLWPEHQSFREHVIRSLPGNPIVQLPQSIWFDEEAAAVRAAETFGGHRGFTLLVRDTSSAELARSKLGIDAQLAPDLAFALPAAARRLPPSTPILWLARADGESPAGALPHDDAVTVADWATWTSGVSTLDRIGRRLRALRPADENREQEARTATWLRDGLALIDGADVIVTERLHGHILACLRGRRHIVLDTLQGKARAFHDTWTYRLGLAEFAVDREHALRLALEHREGARS